MPNFTPSMQRVALLGEKPQNRSLSKLNTGSFALRAMLPVINLEAQYLLNLLRRYSSLSPIMSTYHVILKTFK